ncbi:sensor histidine kinase [Marinagarivorans algicola]|uniref:sensor histidine kinase n=1 Tax=Marinagarivorans algicola TaxID=1513270 RepID=UPI0006B5383F|nr:ATP-binding protein [Marinagarivorans algicola]
MIKASKTLYTRLALCLTVIFLAIGFFSANMLFQASNSHQRLVTQHLHCDLAKLVVKDYLLFDDNGLDLNAAKMIFMKLMVLGPDFEFYILDAKGNIMTYSAEPGVVKRKNVSLKPITDFIRTKKIDSPILGDNPREYGQQKIFSASPIDQNGQTIGYLYVILGSDIFDAFYDSLAQSKMLRSGFWLVIASLCFGLLASLVVIALITKPLRNLSASIQKVRDEGFSKEGGKKASRALAHWDSQNNNEIHVLGSSFKALLDRLEEQYQQVITVDELRKELLTHISHDLRTPLASLLGYLETWQLNEGSVAKADSDQYIEVAARNAKKIANLIEQLFELAHLDSGSVRVNRESFSVAELVQDVLQKFTIEANKLNITLKVEPKDTSILVKGDIEKLERVFSNLIENALRHTQSGGSITVRLSTSGHFVAIDVSDTGIGIPEKDLPHIFDAHFKAGNSIRGNSAHGGIGLAITKKIIDLHHSKISVISEVNRGTTFSFLLPYAS